jgi:aspartate/glutamate racemase
MNFMGSGIIRLRHKRDDGVICDYPRTSLYAASLAETGIDTVLPDMGDLAVIEQHIRQTISGGSSDSDIDTLLRKLQDDGRRPVILGCTELSLTLGNFDGVIDPLRLAAKKVISKVKLTAVNRL